MISFFSAGNTHHYEIGEAYSERGRDCGRGAERTSFVSLVEPDNRRRMWRFTACHHREGASCRLYGAVAEPLGQDRRRESGNVEVAHPCRVGSSLLPPSRISPQCHSTDNGSGEPLWALWCRWRRLQSQSLAGISSATFSGVTNCRTA